MSFKTSFKTSLRELFRETMTFAGVGLIAAVGHYGTLIALVEGAGVAPVPATLAGYVVGGIISYLLNRTHTFASDRPHREAGWRFALVAAVGFGLTGLLMHAFVDRLGFPYLPAQVATTACVLMWSYAANKIWTFQTPPIP